MPDGMQTLDKSHEKTGLELLRQPFPANQISKLPKPTKKQTDDLKAGMAKRDFSLGIRCALCGQWHHKDVVHLDYVGHAALTDRLLDCDPNWNWEPVAFDDRGTPLLDANGGMWIRLTVCGQTRLGYGHADGKKGGDALKEVIGDALRNAAMRFGAALDLWHKGDLHGPDEPTEGETKQGNQTPPRQPDQKASQAISPEEMRDKLKAALEGAEDLDRLKEFWSHKATANAVSRLPLEMAKELRDLHKLREAALTPSPNYAEIIDDEIPF